MRIKVKPEGRKDIYLPDKKSLKQFIKSKKLKAIHNFKTNSSMLLGADHDVKSVLEDIDNADRIAILTGNKMKQNFNHALSVIKNNQMQMFDIGEITEKNLEINK